MSRFSTSRRWKKAKRGDTAQALPAEDIAPVKDLVSALEKTERSVTLYPVGSPILRGFVDEIFVKLTQILQRVRTLELTIGGDMIEWQGEVVFDGSKSDRSFAFALEDGGVKRLVFQDGLTRAEVQAFTDALQEARAVGGEDLTTLLWQRDLRHVGFAAVSLYSDDSAESALSTLDLEAASRRLVDRLGGRAISIDQIASVKKAATDGDEPEPVDLFTLSDPESAEIRRWIADSAADHSVGAAVRILLALLAAVPNEEVRRERLTHMQGLLIRLLDEGDVTTAAEVVASVRRMAEMQPAGEQTQRHLRVKSGASNNPLRAFLSAATGKDVGQRLAKILSRARAKEIDAIEEFVIVTGKFAIGLAGELLGCSTHDQRITQAIAAAMGGDTPLARELVLDPNPKIALVAIQILAQAGPQSAIDEFRRAAAHKDSAVRREAIGALSRTSDLKALERILQSLDDPAPDVRRAAIRAIGGMRIARRPDLFDHIFVLVSDEKSFDERPAPEQEALLALIARLDVARGAQHLERVANRTSLFGRERTHKKRLQAISALGEAATREAEAVLQKLSDSRADEIRAAARSALDRLQIARRSEE